MINELFKRRPARDFLRKYPTEKWKVIIPDVFEIGVLNLKNSFGTYEYSADDFANILNDLRNYKYKGRSIRERNEEKEQFDNYYGEIPMVSSQDQEFYNSVNREPYFSYEEEKNYLRDGNKIRSVSPSTAEVFIGDMNKIRRNIRTNRPRMPYYFTQEEIREQNAENKRNLDYAESKIRAQVMKDKMMHSALKGETYSLPQSYPQQRPQKSRSKSSKSRHKNTNRQIKSKKKQNKNYAITYDKNFKPENIQEKTQNMPNPVDVGASGSVASFGASFRQNQENIEDYGGEGGDYGSQEQGFQDNNNFNDNYNKEGNNFNDYNNANNNYRGKEEEQNYNENYQYNEGQNGYQENYYNQNNNINDANLYRYQPNVKSNIVNNSGNNDNQINQGYIDNSIKNKGSVNTANFQNSSKNSNNNFSSNNNNEENLEEENENQLSMFKISQRTKQLFKKEMADTLGNLNSAEFSNNSGSNIYQS